MYSYRLTIAKTQDDNVRLINYLAKHGHWSPFAHCFMQLRIKAPLFVARQKAGTSGRFFVERGFTSVRRQAAGVFRT